MKSKHLKEGLKIKKNLGKVPDIKEREQRLLEPVKGKITKTEQIEKRKRIEEEKPEKTGKAREEPEKKSIKEVHKVVKEAVKNGTIRIDTRVKDVMTKNFKTVSQEENLRRILELSSQYDIHGFLVFEKDKLIGIITQTDIMKMMETKDIVDEKKDVVRLSELEKLTVRDAMTRKEKLVVIDEDEKTTDSIDLMAKHDVQMLPVLDKKGNPIGIVNMKDVMKSMVSEFFVKSVQMTGEAIVKTGIDDLIDIINERKSVSIKDLAKELNVSTSQIEEWGKILEQKGIIEIVYPPFGPPKLRLKE